jgi:hypothetical protein
MLLVIGATFALFFVIDQSEVKSNLFYGNLFLTVILEILLMGSMFFITSDDNYRLSTIAAAWVVSAYVAFMGIWMSVFGLIYMFTHDINTTAYFVGILGISLIFVIALIFATQGGYFQDEISRRTKHYVTSHRVDAVDFNYLKHTFQRYVSNKKADDLLVNKTNRELEMFIEKATSIPAYTIHENYRLENAVISQGDRIRKNIEYMERIEEPASLNKEISRLSQTIRTAISQIDTLKV